MTTAHATDTFSIGGDLTVHRLGYGAMQLPGPGVWGEPAGRDAAPRVVRAAVEQLKAAQEITQIATVQNLYNLTNRKSQDVLFHATREGIAFIPWFPIATGDLARPDSPVAAVAAELGATPSQVALAWLLQKSPVILPIPGTKSVEHLTENLGAAQLTLSADDMAKLDALA